MELRSYQRDARAAILRELDDVRATLLVLATGLGKTVVFSSIAREFVDRGGRVLVLAHRKELLEQASTTFGRFGLVASIEQGEWRASLDAQIIVASVPSLQGKRLERYPVDAFTLIVIDEAHHARAKTYETIVRYFAGAKVLGVTATPDRGDGLGLGPIFDSCAYRMEIGPGIRAGYLSPIDLRSIVVEGLDLSAVHTRAGELNQSELGALLEDDKALLGVADPLAKEATGRQTICFTASVKQAHAIAKLLELRGAKAAAVDGKTPDDERARVIGGYKAGEIQIVCNAMLLTEGFDSPATSCIALARPTGTRSLIAQMIGRGTRLAAGKASCLVLDFVPERTARIRLAAPADVLAGAELPAHIAERVAQLSMETGGDLFDLIAQAEREHAEMLAEEEKQHARARGKRRTYLKRVGIAYAAHVIPLDELLGEVCPAEFGDLEATDAQVDMLEKMGYVRKEVIGISRRQVKVLVKVVETRRQRGMCSLKQARLLQRMGFRGDLSFPEAKYVLDICAQNGWQAPPHLLANHLIATGE